MNGRNRESADAGFSLVELLAAVMILSVIVLPLLHMFITSARINAKSGRTLQAAALAQNIMEGCKAYTLEEIIAQFEPPKDVEGSSYYTPKEGFYIIDYGLIQGGVRDLTGLMPEHKANDGIYYFGMENVMMQGTGYDVLIKLDTSTYARQSKEWTGDPDAVHDGEFNGRFYAQVGSVAETGSVVGEDAKAADSSYHQDKNLEQDVMKDIRQQIENDILNEGGIVPDSVNELKLEDVIRKRLIHAVFEDARTKDAKGNGQCKATVTFLYEYEYGGMENTCMKADCPYKKGTPGHTNPHSHGYVGSAGGEVYAINRTFSSGNFYLFYYPFYAAGRRIDSIEFVMKDKDRLFREEEPLLRSITLAKQIRSAVDFEQHAIIPELSDAQLRAKESGYMAEVRIDTGGEIDNDLVYRTNLDMNLADGSEIGMGMIDQFLDDFDHIIPCGFSGEDLSSKVTNVIYDMEIVVYEAGAAGYFTENGFEDNEKVRSVARIANFSTEE